MALVQKHMYVLSPKIWTFIALMGIYTVKNDIVAEKVHLNFSGISLEQTLVHHPT